MCASMVDQLLPERLMADASSLPKYIQVSEMLIREIAAGHLADGARLPPERDMAVELGISVGTLRKALNDLAGKGMLERVQGSGNYVRHQTDVASVYAFFRLELAGGGGLPTARVLAVDRMIRPAEMPGDGDAHRIRRLRFLDGQLIALEEIWLDARYREIVTADDLSESMYHFYRHDLGLIIGSAVDEIGVGPAPDWGPDTFGLWAGQMAGYIERISRDADGTAAEYSRTWFDYNKARYISRIGKG
jgi:GntR family transcriptional regulator